MVVSINNQVVYDCFPRYSGKTISIAIDSSKRNTAISVGDANCRLMDVIELNGAQDGTSEVDALILCKLQRDYLKTLFEGAKPVIVGIENIITVDKKKSKGQYIPGTRIPVESAGGISQHMSRFKITAVFMSLIAFFQDNFGITPELVNNQTWKTTVLPKEFNTREHEKGSLDYFKSIGSKYGNYTDDATDSICILKYLQVKHGLQDAYSIESPEMKRFNYVAGIYDVQVFIDPDDMVSFQINPTLTLEENTNVMVNHLENKKYGVARVDINYFTNSQIYQLARGKFKEFTREVNLVVRKETK